MECMSCELLTIMDNVSLSEGIVPSLLVAHSLFKKPLLDPTTLDSFCPVFNLPFWGKMFEKITAQQLQRVLAEADYRDPFQSGFEWICFLFSGQFQGVVIGEEKSCVQPLLFGVL